jgi:hypothetical protein
MELTIEEKLERALDLLATVVGEGSDLEWDIVDFFQEIGYCRKCLYRTGAPCFKGGVSGVRGFLCDKCMESENVYSVRKWEREAPETIKGEVK